MNRKVRSGGWTPLSKGIGGVLFLFAWLLNPLSTFANPAGKIWHTEASPLLLAELKNCVGQQDQLNAETGIAIYSLHNQRFETEWNDTDGFVSPACGSLDSCGISGRVRPQKESLRLGRLLQGHFENDSLDSPLAPENRIRFRTESSDSIQGLAGYVFASDGDTLAVSMWTKGPRDSAKAASELLDSLFLRTTRWYNMERQTLGVASRLLARPDAPSDYLDRLRYFSRALEGTPYSLGPTGEGRYGAIEPLPIVDLNHFDCVTYIESSVGLALSHQASDVIPAVLPIRYHGDTLTYATRNHFFVGDWLGNNPGRFRILRFPGDTVVSKTLYKGKLLAAKGLPKPSSDPVVAIPYLPYEKALQLAGNWTLGKRLVGVAFVTHIDGLDVTHTGFVDGESGKPVLRHASELKGKVVEQDFKEYLESRRGKCIGVLFFEFLPPPEGGL